MQRALETIRQTWESFDSNQKILAVALGAMVLISFALYMNFAGQHNYVTAFDHLDVQDASKIRNTLRDMRIKYRLTHDGSRILVPDKDLDRIYVDLAEKDALPASGELGFELFDTRAFGESDRHERVKFQRALSGHMSRIIASSFDQVETANVWVVPAEKTTFLRDVEPARASVTLKLRRSGSLNSRQVDSIVNLMVYAVADLTPNTVAVLDQNMNMLNAIEDETTGSFRSNLEYQLVREVKLKRKIEDVLAGPIGSGNFDVAVNLEFAFDQVTVEEIEYTGDPGGEGLVVASETGAFETAGPASPSGPVGTPSNIPPTYPGGAGSASGGKSSAETEEKYQIYNKKQTSTKKETGKIVSQSVSVVVNRATEEFTDQMRSTIESLVKEAAGIDAVRGDTLFVGAMPFDATMTAGIGGGAGGGRIEQALYKYLRLALVAGIAFVMFLMVRKIMEPNVFRIEEEVIDLRPKKILTEDIAPIDQEAAGRQKVRDKVFQSMRDDPKGAASVIRSLLQEE